MHYSEDTIQLARSLAAETARELAELSSTTPQHVVDEARAEARRAAMLYWRLRRDPAGDVERARVCDSSRVREHAEQRRAAREGRCYLRIDGRDVYLQVPSDASDEDVDRMMRDFSARRR